MREVLRPFIICPEAAMMGCVVFSHVSISLFVAGSWVTSKLTGFLDRNGSWHRNVPSVMGVLCLLRRRNVDLRVPPL